MLRCCSKRLVRFAAIARRCRRSLFYDDHARMEFFAVMLGALAGLDLPGWHGGVGAKREPAGRGALLPSALALRCAVDEASS